MTGAFHAVMGRVVNNILKHMRTLLEWRNWFNFGFPGLWGTEMNLLVSISVDYSAMEREISMESGSISLALSRVMSCCLEAIV